MTKRQKARERAKARDATGKGQDRACSATADDMPATTHDVSHLDVTTQEGIVYEIVDAMMTRGFMSKSPEVRHAMQAAGLESTFEAMQRRIENDLRDMRKARDESRRLEEIAHAERTKRDVAHEHDESTLRRLLDLQCEDEPSHQIVLDRLQEVLKASPETERPPGAAPPTSH